MNITQMMRMKIKKEDTPKTQIETVYYHLIHLGSLTSWEAINEYGITRLASYISTLKNEYGLNITRKDLTKKNRFNNDVSYGEYSLVNEPKQLQLYE